MISPRPDTVSDDVVGGKRKSSFEEMVSRAAARHLAAWNAPAIGANRCRCAAPSRTRAGGKLPGADRIYRGQLRGEFDHSQALARRGR
jgi:hypothetical protein